MIIYNYMKKLIVLLSVALCFSCVKDSVESVSVCQPELAKVISLSDESVQGSMIIYFNDEATTRVEAGVSRSAATRSGIEEFDAVLEQLGAIRMERVFVANRFEERLRNEGMHRWYVVYFDEDADLNKAAEMFAAVAEVDLVEYNSRMYNITEPATVESPVAVQQNSQLTSLKPYPAFNDPDLGRQWHYINTGHTAVYSGAKVGADVNLDEAWDITAGDPRVVVAIVDGMVQYSHPDLKDNMWVNKAEQSGVEGVDDDNNGYIDDIYGVNFVTYTYKEGNKATELKEGYSDHGTHVAGTVAAVNNNGRGGCGVAGGTGKGDGARLMSCQVFYDIDPDPKVEGPAGWTSGSEVATARAFQYAADNGAAIAQCSYGYGSKMMSDAAYARGSAEKSAIDYFIKYGGGEAMAGGIPIFAAGNFQSNYSSYPGAYRDYISVTAMSCAFTPAYYTNFGPGSNIAAPGGDYLQKYYIDRTGEYDSAVYSTAFDTTSNAHTSKYDLKWGTSMACPHVSGVAALALAHSLNIGKKLTAIDLRNILLGSTHDIDRYCVGQTTGVSSQGSVTTIDLAKFKGKMGVGYIDAFKALMNVQGTPCITVSTGVKQSVDISNAIGGNPATLTFIDGGVTMSSADRIKLGVEGDIVITATGKLQIKCTKPGSGIAKITFIAGGNELGSDEATGGMAVTREVAILSRGFASNGGWF